MDEIKCWIWMDDFLRNDELGDDENESHIFEWKVYANG
jgi:hypothetical protein